MDNELMQRVNQQRVELEGKIAELEVTLAGLKERLADVKLAEQHDAVDHIEDCLMEVDSRYSNLRDFGQMLMTDLKHLLHLQK